MGKNTQSKKAGSRRVLNRPLQREFSSGGVVFKKTKEGVEWFVRQTAASKLYPTQHWMLPKGWIDNDAHNIPGPMASGRVKATEEALQKSALREVEEEAGVEAKIIQKIGTIKYFLNTPDKGRILKFVTFYLMEYVKDLPEGYDEETAEILWLPFNKAVMQLSFSGEKQMLKKAQEMI